MLSFPDFDVLRQIKGEVAMKELTYVKTRHNNVRCFPSCLDTHREQSFCGTPLLIKVDDLLMQRQIKVCGCFITLQAFDKLRQENKFPNQEELIDAALIDPGVFAVLPPRKWGYSCGNDLDRKHVFGIWVFSRENNHLITAECTPAFKLTPAWKLDALQPDERLKAKTTNSLKTIANPSTEDVPASKRIKVSPPITASDCSNLTESFPPMHFMPTINLWPSLTHSELRSCSTSGVWNFNVEMLQQGAELLEKQLSTYTSLLAQAQQIALPQQLCACGCNSKRQKFSFDDHFNMSRASSTSTFSSQN